MAKQTFTTGQVLTAAQMQSLQNTALGGGDATPKVASYVLVAADAGTTVAMNAAGATTITINTGLFAAGDTVFIQNRGAGACTVTAGTATVATAGSLILPQNDAGILYFTSASAAIFYDYIQAGAVSPLTTKGDLYTFSTSDARLAVGTNGTTLVANSATATGLEWQTPAAGGGMTLLSTTTVSGAGTITVSSISGSYKHLFIYGRDIIHSGAPNENIYLRLNGDTGNNYQDNYYIIYTTGGTGQGVSASQSRAILTGLTSDNSSNFYNKFLLNIYRYTETEYKMIMSQGRTIRSGQSERWENNIAWDNTAAITSVSLVSGTSNFGGGTLYIYGVS